MDRATAIEIEGLRKLKTKALRARYRELFGEESRSSNHAHSFLRIAWRLQARAEGDLSERARKRMLKLATIVRYACELLSCVVRLRVGVAIEDADCIGFQLDGELLNDALDGLFAAWN